ncbi:hypothetical protein BH23ACT10_BH23ACT10_30020 [soil metagenome]
MIQWLDGAQAAGLEHAELEDQLDAAGRGLLRQLFQDHLDLRAQRETRVAVVDADGQAHRAVETGHTRALARRCSVLWTSPGWRTGGAVIPTCTPPTRR